MFSFNTQPREGGCDCPDSPRYKAIGFQHTAARRRLHKMTILRRHLPHVSTHSRAKAAAHNHDPHRQQWQRFNTQPREGGCYPNCWYAFYFFCFNTQPREGGCGAYKIFIMPKSSGFNTQPREGGCPFQSIRLSILVMFQHTAARRRLHKLNI